MQQLEFRRLDLGVLSQFVNRIHSTIEMPFIFDQQQVAQSLQSLQHNPPYQANTLYYEDASEDSLHLLIEHLR